MQKTYYALRVKDIDKMYSNNYDGPEGNLESAGILKLGAVTAAYIYDNDPPDYCKEEIFYFFTDNRNSNWLWTVKSKNEASAAILNKPEYADDATYLLRPAFFNPSGGGDNSEDVIDIDNIEVTKIIFDTNKINDEDQECYIFLNKEHKQNGKFVPMGYGQNHSFEDENGDQEFLQDLSLLNLNDKESCQVLTFSSKEDPDITKVNNSDYALTKVYYRIVKSD
mgnify:CR=1 FL=1|tara:strand:- start:451 stop:1119 length:669 start_codon:yes stop_codon:yes gene_type:complete